MLEPFNTLAVSRDTVVSGGTKSFSRDSSVAEGFVTVTGSEVVRVDLGGRKRVVLEERALRGRERDEVIK